MAEEMEDSFLIFAICRTDALARNKEDKTRSIDLSLSNIVGQEEIKCWIKNRLGLEKLFRCLSLILIFPTF